MVNGQSLITDSQLLSGKRGLDTFLLPTRVHIFVYTDERF